MNFITYCSIQKGGVKEKKKTFYNNKKITFKNILILKRNIRSILHYITLTSAFALPPVSLPRLSFSFPLPVSSTSLSPLSSSSVPRSSFVSLLPSVAHHLVVSEEPGGGRTNTIFSLSSVF